MQNSKIHSQATSYVKKEIKNLLPGDILLHPIYRTDGLLMINKNKEMSSSLIDIINKHILPTTPVLVVTSSEALDYIQNNKHATSQFQHDLEHVVHEYNNLTSTPIDIHIFLKEALDESPFEHNQVLMNTLSNYPLWVSLEGKLESDKLKQRAIKVKQEFLDLMNNNPTFSALFTTIKEYNDVLLIHSLNITCLSLMLGLTLELTISELFDLTIAALFCNIGFTAISKQEFKIFLKYEKDNHELIRKHMEIFSVMTMDSPLMRKKKIVYGILDHHEYYNGKGFPNGKQGEEISLFGRIILLAHSYDELVGGYNYTTGLHPLESLKIIFENKDNKFDQNIINIFMHRTTYFKLGEPIFLSHGQIGEIISFDDYIKKPHLPIVRLQSGKIINLNSFV